MITDIIKINRVFHEYINSWNFFPYLLQYPLIDCLSNYLSTTPVLFLSPGTTLTNHISTIKKLAPYYFIITCSSALPIILQYNIIPDLVFIVDHSVYVKNWHLSHNFNYTTLNYVVDPRIDISVIDTIMPSNIYIMNCHNYLLSLLKKYLYVFNPLKGFGTVSNVMMSCASLVLNSPYILLVGQDFCFYNKLSHAKGRRNEYKFTHRGSIVLTKDDSGNEVETQIHLLKYRKQMSELIMNHFQSTTIQKLGKKGLHLYNVTTTSYSKIKNLYTTPKPQVPISTNYPPTLTNIPTMLSNLKKYLMSPKSKQIYKPIFAQIIYNLIGQDFVQAFSNFIFNMIDTLLKQQINKQGV